jgi:hypothetical protein
VFAALSLRQGRLGGKRLVIVRHVTVGGEGLLGGAVGVSIDRSGFDSVDNAEAVERNYFILYFIIRLQFRRLVRGHFVAFHALIGLLARNEPPLQDLLGGLTKHVLFMVFVSRIRHVLID